jgi:hypothetical protein
MSAPARLIAISDSRRQRARSSQPSRAAAWIYSPETWYAAMGLPVAALKSRMMSR